MGTLSTIKKDKRQMERFKMSKEEVVSRVLNVVERRSLKNLERVIERGVESFLAVGSALKEIRDDKLYREEFKSFDAYVKDRWGFQKDYANKLIGSSEVKRKLNTIVSTSAAKKIENEGQLRELKSVPEESLSEVIEKAAEIAGDAPMTAKVLRKAREQVLEPEESEEPSPEEVEPEQEPEPVPEWFKCISNVDAFRRLINGLLKQINDVKEGPGFELLAKHRSSIRKDLENAKNAILGCIPYDVCPYCNGMANDCAGCSDRGWLNESQFNAAPEEMRNAVTRLSSGGNR